jgi:hypothetical protein
MSARSSEQAWRDGLKEAMELACHWLTDICQIKAEPENPGERPYDHPHKRWTGAFREYRAADREWVLFAPIWHTGQTVKALVMADGILDDAALMASARLGVEFIRANRITSGDDAGLILSHEGSPFEIVRTPGMLECADGLIHFAEATGEEEWWDVVIQSLGWILRKAHVPGEGMLRNIYNPSAKQFESYAITTDPNGGKPTLDDGIFMKAFLKTGDPRYRDVAVEIADRLLREEHPPGNWIHFGPSSVERGSEHPRHAYWYGLPMLDMYHITHDQIYLKQAIRSGEWYLNAMRHDGGLFRGTYIDGKTDSFGLAASGSACAAIFWTRLYEELGDERAIPAIRLALDFLMMMQLRAPDDPNLRGAIIEKILPPDGTDRSLLLIRDLGTIFFVQAAAQLLSRNSLTDKVAAQG